MKGDFPCSVVDSFDHYPVPSSSGDVYKPRLSLPNLPRDLPKKGTITLSYELVNFNKDEKTGKTRTELEFVEVLDVESRKKERGEESEELASDEVIDRMIDEAEGEDD